MPPLAWKSVNWLTLGLDNIILGLFCVAVIFYLLEWVVQTFRHRANSYEILFHWMILLPVGLGELYHFLNLTFLTNYFQAGKPLLINPFQYELAIASLSIAVIALLAFRPNFGFRLATVIATTIWMWGQVVAFVYIQLSQSSFALLTVDSRFWVALLVPFILILCIRKLNYPEIETYQGDVKK